MRTRVDLKVLSGIEQTRSRGNVERVCSSIHTFADYSSAAGKRLQGRRQLWPATEMSVVHQGPCIDHVHGLYIHLRSSLLGGESHSELKMLSVVGRAIVVILVRIPFTGQRISTDKILSIWTRSGRTHWSKELHIPYYDRHKIAPTFPLKEWPNLASSHPLSKPLRRTKPFT